MTGVDVAAIRRWTVAGNYVMIGYATGALCADDEAARAVAHAHNAALAVAERQRDDALALASGLQRRLFEECEHTDWDPEKRNSFGDEIAHLHAEVTEAFEWWRRNKSTEIVYEDNGKPRGIPIEFADAMIGMFYLAELHGFDLLQAVEIKHRWNLSRSYPAEGRQLHYSRAALTDPRPPTPTPTPTAETVPPRVAGTGGPQNPAQSRGGGE